MIPNNNDNNDDDAENEKNASERVACSWRRIVLLFAFIIFFPIFPLSLSVVFGGILAWVEGVPFLDGFLYVASNLLNMEEALVDFEPVNIGGMIIDVYVSVVALMTLGIVINIVNLFQVALFVDQTIERCIRIKFLVPIVAIGFVIPFLFGVNAVIFGAILATLEEWDVHDGILYVLSIVLGLANPLTDYSPDTLGGDIIDIIIASMAYGCIAIYVDYVTSLNPASYIRMRIKLALKRHGVTDLAADRYPLDEFRSTNVFASNQFNVEQEDEKLEKTIDDPRESSQELLAERNENDEFNASDQLGGAFDNNDKVGGDQEPELQTTMEAPPENAADSIIRHWVGLVSTS